MNLQEKSREKKNQNKDLNKNSKEMEGEGSQYFQDKEEIQANLNVKRVKMSKIMPSNGHFLRMEGTEEKIKDLRRFIKA